MRSLCSVRAVEKTEVVTEVKNSFEVLGEDLGRLKVEENAPGNYKPYESSSNMGASGTSRRPSSISGSSGDEGPAAASEEDASWSLVATILEIHHSLTRILRMPVHVCLHLIISLGKLPETSRSALHVS